MRDKKTLRREMRARLALIDAADAQARSEVISREVERHIAVSGAKVVALFSPLADEPQIWPLVERLARRMSVVLPRVEGDVMNFYGYGDSAMAKGAYGIDEPQGGLPVDADDIDAVIVPGVAFADGGARMGRGKGYYDKYLSQGAFRALKIGVCYPVQIVDELPCEQHDINMDCVIIK